jgi:hypothetical protein
MWRITQAQIWERMIIRALRRDVKNGGKGWGCHIARLADQIESGEVEISFGRKEEVNNKTGMGC